MRTLEERFFSKVRIPLDVEACWEWVGRLDRYGYGQFWYNGAQTTAHRVSAAIAGETPEAGLHFNHTCRNRRCVNPLHLHQVSPRENTLADGSLAIAKKRASATHCIHGHAFDTKNTRIRPDGTRECRCCHADKSKRQRAARKAFAALGEKV